MQHGEEDGAFKSKPMLTLARELLDDGPAPGLVPQPFEHESRPDAPHVSADCGSVVEGVDHDRLCGKARAGSKKSFQLPTLAQVLDTPEGGDHLLADFGVLWAGFGDLEGGVL